MRSNSHGLKSSCGARRSSGGRRDVGAYRGEAPRRGSRGASSVRPLLPVGVRHRGVARQCPPNRGRRQSDLHRPPLCFSAMLTREFSVMVGLMSGKAKSAIPQNSVGSRSRGWVGQLVCGSCHQLGNHSWWWEPPDSNRQPPACKASSGKIATWADDRRRRSQPPSPCPWVSVADRSRLL